MSGSRRRRLDRLALFRLVLLVLLVAAGSVVVLVVGVPDADSLRAQFAHSGILGALGFAALYAVLTLTPVPASALTIGAGIVFGLGTGLIVVEIGATVGATAALYIGRWLGRDGVQQLGGKRLAALDRTLRRRGLVSVLLLRLVPLFPYAAVNYLSGLTAVRPRDYIIGTAIGIIPASAAYTAVGAYGAKPGSAPFLISLGVLLLLTVGSLLIARRRQPTAAPDVSATDVTATTEPAATD